MLAWLVGSWRGSTFVKYQVQLSNISHEISNFAKRINWYAENNDYNTYQVKNYDRFELASFSEGAKRQYRDEHWEQDLQKAFDAGKRMAENILR